MQAKPDLSAFDNSWYKHGAMPKRLLWIVCSGLFFNHGFPIGSSLKVAVLKLFGAKIGKGVVIKPFVTIKHPWLLSVGNHSWIGEQVWIDNLAQVTIGANCCISQGAMLLTGNHDYKKVAFDLVIGEIVLEDGSWVGAQSVVCPGVTCKEAAVLAVGSVATKDLEAFTIYSGNPAQEVRKRNMHESEN